MLREPIVRQLCMGRKREINKETKQAKILGMNFTLFSHLTFLKILLVYLSEVFKAHFGDLFELISAEATI